MGDPSLTRAAIIEWTIAAEGGYVHHPRDPGGATKYGITQRTYDEWCRLRAEPVRDVKELTITEAAHIYEARYWGPSGAAAAYDADQPRIAAATFDWGVLAGCVRSRKHLQAALGVDTDGVIGPETAAALRAANDTHVLRMLAVLRKAHHLARAGEREASLLLKIFELPVPVADASQSVFLRGWLDRLVRLFQWLGITVEV